MGKIKRKNGITLIALIITIIVMLILVTITVSIAVNDGLFKYAGKAMEETKYAADAEARFDGFTVDGVTFKSLDDYMALKNAEGDLIIMTMQCETDGYASIIYMAISEKSKTEMISMTNEEKKEAFVNSYNALSIYYDYNLETVESWDDIVFYDEANPPEVTTVEQAYERIIAMNYIGENDFTGVYDFLAQAGDIQEEDTVFNFNGETEIGDSVAFSVLKNGTYIVTASNSLGTGSAIINVTKCKEPEPEEFSKIQGTKQTLTIDGYTVTIPAGFAYGISENVGHVTSGLVITDSVERKNGKNYSNGNEFVWIPVDENLKVGTASNNKLMAKISSGTDYEGVLYTFGGSSANPTSTEMSNYGVNTNSYKEPAFLESSHNTIGLNQTIFQNEYNSMIASVKANKGFYMSRYEMGIVNNKPVSKPGIIPAQQIDGCVDIYTGEGAMLWWGLYDKARSYTNSQNSVQSQMMWGSQYDAMLNFALEGEDKTKVNGMQGYDLHNDVANKTGFFVEDKIINIFDLEGNLEEWTAETYRDIRVTRGRRHEILPGMHSMATIPR